ncbi:hypothetical protein JAAARDRAFT_127817 [Jaapia argillacea MUCL 33604]|uniref:Arsenical-resistance protein ACR3 n=1 Tax=Jaapia argillacea MUCL 33604 TaxID=933084 RepID=A0A067Q6D0_9AGAM|nr:hypothetical protein JAAARDRAFT_127817 [Jaapia argillacea MUCL 33604]
MILGILIGVYAPNVQKSFDTATFNAVSVPIAIGLIIMMYPVLTKVQYERLPLILSSRGIWLHISLSLFLNWIIGPFIMLGVAWATLPDLPTYRAGVILVGLARCIAMVMIWNQLAKGDANYCAILVVINSVLQIVLYSPYAVLFINILGGQSQSSNIHVSYREVAISVLIYLGIPLLAGIITRFTTILLFGRNFFENRFLPIISPFALLGLLYTIIVMFAYQGHHIVHNLRPVFRVFVPMILYFAIMWTMAFSLAYWLNRKEAKTRKFNRVGGKSPRVWGYEMAVVQSFTAGSNNFELAIAVAIAVYGVGSDQALAATIGPLIEVPVLLALTWVALFLEKKLIWDEEGEGDVEGQSKNITSGATPNGRESEESEKR